MTRKVAGRTLSGGTVSCPRSFSLGQLVGYNLGVITGSYSIGDINGTESYTGGLVGYNRGSISFSYSGTNITAMGAIGGLVSYNDGGGSITQSYATGNLIDGQNSAVGGLVATNSGSILQSYATGAASIVSNDGGVAGGLVGYLNGEPGLNGSVSQSYSTGQVTGGPLTAVGGLIGFNHSGGVVNSSYWNTQTTGQATSAGGAGLTTAQLQSGLPVGFDPSAWSIFPGHNSVYSIYPKLIFSISQLSPSSYASTTGVAWTDRAQTCMATVFAMTAHFVGAVSSILDAATKSALTGYHVDDFWNSHTGATQAVLNQDGVRFYKSGNRSYSPDLKHIAAPPGTQPLYTALDALRDGPVMIGGTIGTSSGGTEAHWMLAVGRAADGTAVFVNDPWTGTKVEIDSTTWTIPYIMDPITGAWVSLSSLPADYPTLVRNCQGGDTTACDFELLPLNPKTGAPSYTALKTFVGTASKGSVPLVDW